jgi:hypothetical protein
VLAIACALFTAGAAHAQSQILFSDDFESGTIDPAKWQLDDKPFESGVSDIQAYENGGVLEFSGTVTAQYWPGLNLVAVPTFKASLQTNLVVTVDRVSELGAGTASRSAIWITDANRSNYVLFADDRNEGGWHYNRKIGQNGDSPNGSGVDIAAFNDPSFDDGGYHRVKVVANGETVKLYVDDIFGTEVAFPFTDGIVIEIGSYARALNDTAFTQFDNFQVEAVGAISFSQESINVSVGQSSSDVTVRIPEGANATQAVQVQVVSADPSIAVPAGGAAGTLSLTFPAGGATSQTFKAQGIKSGGTQFTFLNDQGLLMANTLAVNVPFPVGVILQDDFSGDLDLNKWDINTAGFESGTGGFTVGTTNGELVISGSPEVQYWAGASIRSKEPVIANKDLNIQLDIDRTSMERTGTAGRSTIYLTTLDRSQYIAFSQNNGEGGWTINIKPGNPTGGGTLLTPLADKDDLLSHHMRAVIDGETARVYLDGILGGTFNFPLSTGIYVEIGGYARAQGDVVTTRFDNFQLSGVLPCTEVTPASITTELGVAQSFDVAIPTLLNADAAATITITSSDPTVAVPAGATAGVLKLTFAPGATNRQTVSVNALAPGLATFNIVDDQGGCVANPIDITITPALLTLISDDFSGAAIDPTKWRLNEAVFGAGVLTNSTATQTGGQVQFHVTPGSEDWPGLTYATVDTFETRPTEPLIFEVDRISHVGSGASTRTGVWITDATRAHYIFFAYDDNDRGWQYNRLINQAGDNPTGQGANISAFDGNEFSGPGQHHLKIIANGSTAKFYVDNVLGADIPFPFSEGIRFEFGAFARSVRDVVDATFDNAQLRGPLPCIFTDVTSVELPSEGSNAVVTVTIPRLLNATVEAKVTVTSSNPSVAIPVGGSNGALTLTFPAGGATQQSFEVQRIAPGTAVLTLNNPDGDCVRQNVSVASLEVPVNLLSDNFDTGTLDPAIWSEDSAPFETGAADTTVSAEALDLEFTAVGTSNYWGGHGIDTVAGFAASAVEPLTFEIDRTYLVNNNSTGVRAGVWIMDSTGTNWVFFADLSEGATGWSYNRKINQTGDNPTGGGINIPSLDGGAFDDGALHHLKLVANGSTVKFYVDNVFGTEVAFPISSGIHFRVGVYTRAEFDLVNAGFDNVTITGNVPAEGPGEISIAEAGSQVSITWEGTATLEEATSVDGPWSPLSSASSPYIPPDVSGTRFFRLSK